VWVCKVRERESRKIGREEKEEEEKSRKMKTKIIFHVYQVYTQNLTCTPLLLLATYIADATTTLFSLYEIKDIYILVGRRRSLNSFSGF
jgi:hypothetical protein